MAGYTTGNTAPVTDPLVLRDAIKTAFVSGNSVIWYAPVAGGDIVFANGTKEYYVVQSTDQVDAFVTSQRQNVRYRVVFETIKDPTSTPPGKITAFNMYVGNEAQLAFNSGQTDMVISTSAIKLVIFGGSVVPSSTSEFNYRMSFTSRGIGMSIWRTNTVNSVGGNFSLVIQRPVNPTTGLPQTAGLAPIFAMWHDSTSGANYFNWGLVNYYAADGSSVPSSVQGATNVVTRFNMYRITLDWSHPNLFDNNSHVVKFPYGLATLGHLYLDELDMMCLINATAFASRQDVNITMYGETAERKYQTTWGEVLYGNVINVQTPQPKVVSGARIGILSLNGGIDAVTTPSV